MTGSTQSRTQSMPVRRFSGIGVIDLTPANEIDNFIPFLQSHAQHLTCERAYSGYEIGVNSKTKHSCQSESIVRFMY